MTTTQIQQTTASFFSKARTEENITNLKFWTGAARAAQSLLFKIILTTACERNTVQQLSFQFYVHRSKKPLCDCLTTSGATE